MQHGIRQKSKSKWIVAVNFEDVNVERKLSVLKPIQATWLMEMYNFLTSAQGRVHVLKGWEKAGIKGVVTGRQELLPVDPYQDIYTLK